MVLDRRRGGAVGEKQRISFLDLFKCAGAGTDGGGGGRGGYRSIGGFGAQDVILLEERELLLQALDVLRGPFLVEMAGFAFDQAGSKVAQLDDSPKDGQELSDPGEELRARRERMTNRQHRTQSEQQTRKITSV